MARIMVVGLNPAWQKILEFDSLLTGRVNRARRLTELGSGKGLNTAWVMRHLGHEVWLLQVLGRTNGLACETGQETRICITLIDHAGGTATELIEPFSISAEPQVEERIVDLITEPGLEFDAVLYCGSLPDGLSPLIYLTIHRLIAPGVSILDSVRSIPEELFSNVTCTKINHHEFNEVKESFQLLRKKDELNSLFLLTDGANAARMLKVSSGLVEERRFFLPTLARVLNPIGAGDAVTAGLAHFLLTGLPTVDAFRHALAMGSASCLQLEPARYDESDYERILSQIRVELVVKP
jgi:fructose-1-phosphate kinase PfkB-like protein